MWIYWNTVLESRKNSGNQGSGASSIIKNKAEIFGNKWIVQECTIHLYNVILDFDDSLAGE